MQLEFYVTKGLETIPLGRFRHLMQLCTGYFPRDRVQTFLHCPTWIIIAMQRKTRAHRGIGHGSKPMHQSAAYLLIVNVTCADFIVLCKLSASGLNVMVFKGISQRAYPRFVV